MADSPQGWLSPDTVKTLGFPVAVAGVLLGIVIKIVFVTDAYLTQKAESAAEAEARIEAKADTVLLQHRELIPLAEEQVRLACIHCYREANGDKDAIDLCACSARKNAMNP